MRAARGAISSVLQGLLLLAGLASSVDDCPASVHPLEGRCKIDCFLDSHCKKWQYCCKTGCWQTCVNYTLCQMQQIEASISRRPFPPICKADGSFSEFQCTPNLKCWRVDMEGRKIQDIGGTLNYKVDLRQSMEAKERRIGQYSDLDDEIEEKPIPREKTRCERARERRLLKRKTRPGIFVPRCKANGDFKLTQCHKRTKYCWCVDREGKQIQGTKLKNKRPNCKTSSSEQCGRRKSLYSSIPRTRRIVGGRESIPNSWPWMVALFYNRTKLGCGGSIIKPSWIVTAAHCFSDVTSKNPADWDVRIGEHSFRTTEGKERKLAVRQIIIHPDYQRSNSSHPGDNDIALVRLSTSVQFGRHINSICMPDSFSFFNPGKRCIITGWGHTSWKGNSSHVLREAWIDLVSKPDCNSESSYNGTIGPRFLCAGFKEGGTDSCYYDSGGPLACAVPDGRWILAGIVSWGEKCALPHKYGVYTNVHEFTQWMRRTMTLDR